MSAATVARLKITLDDVSPAILHRVEVPFDIRLDRLHLTVQAAMGWTNSHLYEIRAGDVGFSTPDPDADFYYSLLSQCQKTGQFRPWWQIPCCGQNALSDQWIQKTKARL